MAEKKTVKHIGRHVDVQIGKGDMVVVCVIVAVKRNHGLVQYRVVPTDGRGSAWIDSCDLTGDPY